MGPYDFHQIRRPDKKRLPQFSPFSELYRQTANAVGVRAHTVVKRYPGLKGHLAVFETDKIVIKLIFYNYLSKVTLVRYNQIIYDD